MTRDDMVISHVFNVNNLKVGNCYKFKCGNSGARTGILTNIKETTLTFNTVNNYITEHDCNLCPYDINANDFYNDTESYIIELV